MGAAEAQLLGPEERVCRLGLYAPHAGQWPLHQSTARYLVANTGRRFGKTTAGVNEAAKYAWENPGSLTWWIGPTYQHLEVAFEMLCGNFREAMSRTPVLSPYPRIWWANGSRTHMHTGEKPDNLRGRGIGLAILDEAAMEKRRLWEEVVRPTLADTRGRAIFLSTPRGRGNWYYDLWMRGQDRAKYPDYESWSFPSSARTRTASDPDCSVCRAPYGVACAHPALHDEIEEARRSLPWDTFRQEWLAEFLEGSAGVFRNIMGCIGGRLMGPEEGHSYVVGWDPGRWQDPSVVVVMDMSVEPKQVVWFDRFLGPDWIVQANRVLTLAEHYKARIVMDSTHGSVGDPLFTFINNGQTKVPVQRFDFNKQSKQALVEHLILRVERHEVQYPDPLLAAPGQPDLRVMLNEMEAFERTVTEAGSVRYSAPEGLHDDCVIGLALAAWGACHGGGLYETLRREYDELQTAKRPASMAAVAAMNAA